MKILLIFLLFQKESESTLRCSPTPRHFFFFSAYA